MRLGGNSIVACIVVLAALTLPATAREPDERTGYFTGAALGIGYAAWDWADPGSENGPGEVSGAMHVHMGRAIRNDLLVGLQAAAWVKEYDVSWSGEDIASVRAEMTTAVLTATWFPGDFGWSLRVGTGLARARGEVVVVSGADGRLRQESTDMGVALLGGTGYEWRFTKRLAMGPQVELSYLFVDGDVIENALVLDGGLAMTWYW